MFRKHVKAPKREKKDRIVWRSHEVTRIEAFSDAVFAFAVTLLIVSLEVPKSFDYLWYSMISFFPFSLCFMLIFYVWREQYIFFRRYGLHDSRTISINGVLIFMVLFFVYPLKFLSNALMQGLIAPLFHIHTDPNHMLMMKQDQSSLLMFVYSSGYLGIFSLFSMMYYNALQKKKELNLTDSEIFETKTSLYCHIAMASFGVASIIIASFGSGLPSALSGFIYSFVGVPIVIINKRREKLHRIKYEQFGTVSEESK